MARTMRWTVTFLLTLVFALAVVSTIGAGTSSLVGTYTKTRTKAGENTGDWRIAFHGTYRVVFLDASLSATGKYTMSSNRLAIGKDKRASSTASARVRLTFCSVG
jgi:hypothetical protein